MIIRTCEKHTPHGHSSDYKLEAPVGAGWVFGTKDDLDAAGSACPQVVMALWFKYAVEHVIQVSTERALFCLGL